MEEKDLYGPIQRWLQEQGYVAKKGWINKGATKCRVDVIGIRNSGSDFQDDIEIVAVEAKVQGDVKALGQTANYRDFSHKVYFATSSREKAKYLEVDCRRKHLGLLFVDVKREKVDELLMAPVEKPRSEVLMAEFLGGFDIGQCTLCQCYVDYDRDEEDKEWDDSLSFHRKTQFKKDATRINRFICKACKEQITKMRSKERG